MKAITLDGEMTTRQYLEVMTETFRAGRGWLSATAYILKHGRAYTLTEASFDGRRGKMKECYRNAAMMAFMRPDLTYVEGYAQCGGLPIEHAWLVDADGNVIDPTIRRTKLDTMPMSDYFGVPFDTELVMKTAHDTGYWGMIGFHNRELLRDPDATVVEGD